MRSRRQKTGKMRSEKRTTAFSEDAGDGGLLGGAGRIHVHGKRPCSRRRAPRRAVGPSVAAVLTACPDSHSHPPWSFWCQPSLSSSKFAEKARSQRTRKRGRIRDRTFCRRPRLLLSGWRVEGGNCDRLAAPACAAGERNGRQSARNAG